MTLYGVYWYTQWRNEPKHFFFWGGAQSLRASEATKPEGA